MNIQYSRNNNGHNSHYRETNDQNSGYEDAEAGVNLQL